MDDDEREIWTSLDHMGLSDYIISSHGRIVNIVTRAEISGSINMSLNHSTKGPTLYSRHTLVALTFIPHPKNERIVDSHVDVNDNVNLTNDLKIKIL
jgi:hypothetical protein